MDRLSGLDASFLYFETPAHLMHVWGLLTLDTSTMPDDYSFAAAREQLRERLASNPQFRRKLHNPLLNIDHPVWIDDEDFDIEHHVRRVAVPSPGGDRELADVCADIAAQPLDRSRPLWEMWLIEGCAGGAAGGLAVMTKMHHATVDGVSGASLISELCSLEPDAAPLGALADKPPPPPRPRDRDIVLTGVLGIAKRPVRLAQVLPSTVTAIPNWIQRARRGKAMPAPFSAPRTSLNGTVTSHRSVAFTRLELAEVKEVKNAFGTTVNDVVLALWARCASTSSTTTNYPTRRWSRWCRCRCTARARVVGRTR